MLSIFSALVKIVFSSQGQVKPWISWEDTHAALVTAEQFPSQVWRADAVWNVPVESERWAMAARGLIFFALFGMAGVSKLNFSSAYQSITNWLGCGREFTSYGGQVRQQNCRNAVASPNFGTKSGVGPISASPSTLNIGRSSIVLDITSAPTLGGNTELSHTDNALRLEDDEDNFTAFRSSTITAEESVFSASADHGHGLTSIDDNAAPLERGSFGVVTFPTAAVLHRFKDLPLLPEGFSRPTSMTTSASMYSTKTLPETEFTFTVDVVYPSAAFFHSQYAAYDLERRFSWGTPHTSSATRRPEDLDPGRDAGESFLDLSAAPTAPRYPFDHS